MEIEIECENGTLKALLEVPDKPLGMVIFAHGSGSSRLSVRNQYVARELNRAGFVTLLLDLLTEEEDQDASLRFEMSLLAKRLITAKNWVESQKNLKDLKIGYFGASTGAAAALIATEKEPVHAVVSRGGRPDLVLDIIDNVKTPTLFIVGSLDHPVVEMNEKAFNQLKTHKELKIIEGATHLFEEEGALEEVSILAILWFIRYLA